MNTFDSNLQRLRKLRNMKQEDLAQRMNVSRQTVSGWETGRRQPDLDTLKKLAEVLEADIHELIYGDSPEEHPKFQKKHTIRTAVYGSIVAVLLLFRLLVWPYFKVLCATYYWGVPLFVCHYLLPLVGFFAFGALFPLLIQLFAPVQLEKRWAGWCFIGFFAALMPAILFWLGVFPLPRWIPYSVGHAFLTCILPFISGVCKTLGTVCEKGG